MKITARKGVKGRRQKTVRENFTPAQLAAIGEVAIAWNEAEWLFNLTVGQALTINPVLIFELTSRINGFEGKLALLKAALKGFPFLAEDRRSRCERTLDALAECRGYRDAVIHARAFDTPLEIGLAAQNRARDFHILLSVKALNGVYDRLVIIRDELVQVAMIVTMGTLRQKSWVPTGEQWQQDEATALEYDALIQEHQKKRQSLPPLPVFPQKDLTRLAMAEALAAPPEKDKPPPAD